jgi:hypothetical protein
MSHQKNIDQTWESLRSGRFQAMVDDQEMPRAVEFLISQVLESSTLRPELFGIVFDLLFEILL